MIDGELRGEELTDTVKHIASCSECMELFIEFQRLQERTDAETAPPVIPGRIWENIESEATPIKSAKSIPFRSTMFKAISIAAVLAISFILGYQSRSNIIPMMTANNPIVLASNSGKMNEAQFLSLTRELLTADPVYHQKMYMILHSVASQRWEESFEPIDNDYLEGSRNSEKLQQTNYDRDGETFKF